MSKDQLSTRPVGTVQLYGCGGGGINIAKEYSGEMETTDISKFSACFLDTSDSNLADHLLDNTFLFSDPSGETDGSGKVKAQNAELIEKSIPEVLRKFPAKDMNIIVYTASGGTGNVAGYLLHRKLLEAGHSVVSVVIGTFEAERTAKNTMGTIASLSDLAEDVDKPVIFHYSSNARGVPRSTVDKEAHLIITALAMLSSRRNHGLDTADIKSFLDYTKPRPDIKPSLARIHVYDDADVFDKEITEPLSVAYLVRNADEIQPAVFAPYSCDGILPDVAQTRNLFFGIETKSLFKIQSDIETIRADLASREETRSIAPTFGDASAKKSKSGIYTD